MEVIELSYRVPAVGLDAGEVAILNVLTRYGPADRFHLYRRFKSIYYECPYSDYLAALLRLEAAGRVRCQEGVYRATNGTR